MAPTRVILMSCGSYNPPTNMHLRMFEIARDHLHRMGTHVVVGGVISPVHDAYAKKELASATHRCAMLRLALQNSDWIRLSTWETRQNCWTKTRLSLQHHQNLLNSVLFDTNDIKHHMQIEDLDWIPEDIKNSNDTTPIQIKLLCGADLLESFGTCDLWAEEDIDAIVGEHGLVVITREGSNPNKFIYDSDILSRHMHNIYIVTEWIPNEVSSSRIRRALKRGESVRYLLQDAVIHYIYKSGIYDAKATTTTTIKLELTSPNANNYLTIDPKYQSTFLTPSPSDVTMDSPSPVEIISIDVPDSVLRKNLQNATGQFIAPRHCGLEEAREKFINAIVAENGNAKLLANAKAAYPGQAKQIIATESGESRILEEVGLPDEDRKVAKVQPRQLQAEADDVAESSANVSVRAKEVRNQESGSAIGSPGRSECLSASSKSDARRECALSDFSVDKEEYRMREGGLVDEEDPDELIADEEWKETQARMKEFAGKGGAGGEEVRKDGDVERADVLDDSVGEVSESLSSSRALVLVSEASSKEQGEGGELIVQREETVGLIVENEELVDLIVHQKNHVELIVEREEPVDIILQRTEQVGLIVDKEDRVDVIVQRQERVDVIVKPKDYGEVIVEKDPLDVILQQSSYGGVIVDGKDPRDFTVNSMTLQEESVELIVHEKDPDSNVQVKDLDLDLKRSSSRDSIVQRSPSRDSIVQRSPSRDSIVQRSPSRDSILQQSPSRDSIVQESPSRDSIVQRSPSQDSILKGSPSKDLIVQRSPTNDVTELFQEQDLTAIKKVVSMQDPDKHAKSSVCKFSPVEETLEPSSSVSDDNTSVRAQSVIDVELLSAKDDLSPDPEEIIGEVISKRDSNLEIDGKYLKSIVNSRKSPRKTKSGQLRAFSDDNVRRSTSGTQDLSSRSESKSSAVKAKSEADKFRSDRDSARPRVPVSSRIQELAQECDTRKIQRYGPLKGSLDSVMTASETRIIPRRKPKAAKEAFSKKSKSYESFKRVQEVFLEEPLKTDSSTSQLITANPLDTQTDEFCSVCCYVNELAMRAEHEEISSPNQETFYTLQSNCSSLIDEDSTECDICSSWNLQESSEALDRKLMTVPDDQPLCEVCEICGELGAAYDPNQDLLEHPEFIENQIPPSGLLKSSKDLRFVDECPTDPYVDEDSFEIENCGFQSGTESTEDRGQFPSENDLIDELGRESRPFYLRTTTHTPPTRDKSREKYLIPKDEVALSNSGGMRKIGRKGSLLKKKIDDSISAAQDKRRYSSADNLQVAKVFAKGSDKFVRSKGTKLIGSADNIRTSRSSRRCKSLQRSADNVRYIDSSTDNLDSLAESLGKEDEFDGSIDWSDRPKVRDNETVKMILTKHGIKIISEKETAL